MLIALAGNPTTGYEWQIEETPDGTFLERVPCLDYHPDPDLMGAGGTFYERWHLSAPSREGGDEKCLLLQAAQFVVQWRYGNKERQSLCVRHEVSPGMGTEVSEVDTAERAQRTSERVI